jgi:copper(I)-binding protein
MRRLLLQFAAASTLTAVSIVTAYAHASLERGEAAPASYKAVLKIPHGCDGKATNLLRVDIPEGFVGVKPMPKAGWTLETTKGDYAERYDLHGKAVTSLTILAAGDGVHGHGSHSVPVASDAVAVGDLTITGAWARAMLPGQPAGGGYLTIANKGQVADKLVSASSPSAGKVEIHTMEVVNDVMVMRPLDGGLDIPAGATVELKPGGLHVMFKAVKEPFKEGRSVPVTLQFEKSGKVEVMLPVQAKQGTDEHAGHGG